MTKRDLYTPSKIVAGFKNRDDTFTGKLAYVTYDKGGKRRNENSWKQWIDTAIPVEEFDNVPTGGFIFNKGVKHISYQNFGSEKFRIYDIRGVEFEINAANMVLLLQYCEISKGEIQQECVYAWVNGVLNLVPTNSNLYAECMAETNAYHAKHSIKLKSADLVIGSIYASKNNTSDKYVYMGKRDLYSEVNGRKARNLSNELFGVYYCSIFKKEPSVNVFAHLIDDKLQNFVKCEVGNIAFERDGYDIRYFDTELLRREQTHNSLRRSKKKKYLVKKLTMQKSDFCDFYLTGYKHYINNIQNIDFDVQARREYFLNGVGNIEHITQTNDEFNGWPTDKKETFHRQMEDFVRQCDDDLFLFFLGEIVGMPRRCFRFSDESYAKLIERYQDFKSRICGTVSFGKNRSLFTGLNASYVKHKNEVSNMSFVWTEVNPNAPKHSIVLVDNDLYVLNEKGVIHNPMKSGFFLAEHMQPDCQIVERDGIEYIKPGERITTEFKNIKLNFDNFSVVDFFGYKEVLFSSFPDTEKEKIIDVINTYGYLMVDNPTAEELDNPPDGYQIIEI